MKFLTSLHVSFRGCFFFNFRVILYCDWAESWSWASTLLKRFRPTLVSPWRQLGMYQMVFPLLLVLIRNDKRCYYTEITNYLAPSYTGKKN